MNKIAVAGIALTLSLPFGFAAEAHAPRPTPRGIVCDGAFQVVAGREIATPYCGDACLAEQGRSLGAHTSASAVRNNPAVKDEVCRLIGPYSPASEECPNPYQD